MIVNAYLHNLHKNYLSYGGNPLHQSEEITAVIGKNEEDERYSSYIHIGEEFEKI